MNHFSGVIKAIFIKDLLSEFRTRQTLPAMICLGILIAWIFRIATEPIPMDTSVIAVAVLLVSLLFSVILAAQSSFAVEQHNDAITAILLACPDSGNIYIAKMLVNIAMLCIFEIVVVPVVFMLFNTNITGRWLQLIVVLLLTNIGLSSIATLFGSIAQQAKPAGSILSILVMAVLCPMVIPAVFALLILFGTTGQLLGAGALTLVGDFKTALGFLAAFDVIFVTICWLLFGFVVSE